MNTLYTTYQECRSLLRHLDTDFVEVISGFAPWLAPIPSAALVYKATQHLLHFSPIVSWISALIIETLGLTSIHTALLLWNYNQNRRKTDEPAPVLIALGMVTFYLVCTVGLTFILETFPMYANLGVIFFPFLGVMGGVNLALRSDLNRRVRLIAAEKAERKEKRQEASKANRQNQSLDSDKTIDESSQKSEIIDDSLDRLQAGRKAKLDTRIQKTLDVFGKEPGLSISDAARAVGVSRQTMHSYLGQLKEQGRIRQNGHGVEIL